MSEQNLVGVLAKMRSELAATVNYQLPVGDQHLALNEWIGKTLQLTYDGAIFCSHCGRKTKKSFSQGYCYPCFKKLPQCDTCIMSPEKCHYDQGSCRDAAWGEQFCMTDHIVYLSNSSGLKVGITRATQIPTRWIDQGATQAMPLMRVTTRQQSGLVESMFKASVNDRTNWRAMLKGPAEPLDLQQEGQALLEAYQPQIHSLQNQFGVQAIQTIENPQSITIDYPVIEYPTKVTSQSFDLSLIHI